MDLNQRSSRSGSAPRFRTGCLGVGCPSVRAAAFALGALVLSGCYTYVPLTTPSPQPGTRVSADLTRDGTDSLAGYLGRNVVNVDGRVMAAGADTISLSVVSVTTSNGESSDWQGETVTIPQSMISRLSERRLARGSTALLVGGVIVLFVAAAKALGGALGGSGNGQGPPTTK